MSKISREKQAQWRSRMEAFEASGLTVTQFCRQADVTPHTFYYWRKRLNQATDTPQRPAESPQTPRRSQRSQVDAPDRNAMVDFCWSSGLRMSVPAHCVDAIRCILEWAHRVESDGHAAAGGNFQQVVLAR